MQLDAKGQFLPNYVGTAFVVGVVMDATTKLMYAHLVTAKHVAEQCLRPGCPLSLDDARRLVTCYVEHYNTVRLHSALGYVTPQAMLEGRQKEIWAERDRKLEAARSDRQRRRLLGLLESSS